MKDFSTLVPKFCKGYVEPLQDDVDVNFEMRKKDFEETSAASGLGSSQAIIKQCIQNSDYTWTIKIGGETSGIFGLGQNPYREDIGIPWLIGGPKMNRMSPVAFVRISKMAVRLFHLKYTCLSNFVLCEYTEAVNWLSVLGFQFSHERYTLGDRQFYLFWKYALSEDNHVQC